MNDFMQDPINGLAGRLTILDDVMKVAAQDLIFLIVPLLFALWFWPGADSTRALRQRVSAVTVLAILAALGLGSLVADLHTQVRPFVSDAGTRLLVSHSPDNGFPSDHATVAFAAAGVLVWWKRIAGAIAVSLAALIGVARIFVGVHWPGDILAGAAIGLIAGTVLAQTIPWLAVLQTRAAALLPRWLVSSPG